VFEEFSKRVRKLRQEKGLSQLELAKKSDLQASAISHFETGRRTPSMENLGRLADALGVSSDFLLGRATAPEASGPAIAQLVADYSRLSSYDQHNVLRFAAMLAEKRQDEGVKEK